MTSAREPMLTKRQREKVAAEILGLIGPSTGDADERAFRFVATQVGRQTSEEFAFCSRDVRGRP